MAHTTIDDAVRYLEAERVGGYAVYRDGSTRLFYVADNYDLALLAEKLDDPETRDDAYSLWCSETEAHGFGRYCDAIDACV